MFGESVVMRVLDRSNVQLDLDKIGLRDDDLATVRQLIHKPNGVVVVTGPTGSGKTTTLYSALRELNDPSSKLITAEDPVEYDIDGIIQCQIKPDIELTFARFSAPCCVRTRYRAGRRNPRQRNRQDRHRSIPHGPPGIQHAAHE
jgi:type IV pilus assembly protein PilB